MYLSEFINSVYYILLIILANLFFNNCDFSSMLLMYNVAREGAELC